VFSQIIVKIIIWVETIDIMSCPECGEILVRDWAFDEDTDEILIDCFCDGAGEDMFHIQVRTGLTQDDLNKLTKEGTILPAKIVLVQRTDNWAHSRNAR
jgi:hypothetical protein